LPLGDCSLRAVFLIYWSSPPFGQLFRRSKLCINSFKCGLGHILGDFFTDSSGHPVRDNHWLFLRSVCTRMSLGFVRNSVILGKHRYLSSSSATLWSFCREKEEPTLWRLKNQDFYGSIWRKQIFQVGVLWITGLNFQCQRCYVLLSNSKMSNVKTSKIPRISTYWKPFFNTPF
jgi:hypothetical protein